MNDSNEHGWMVPKIAFILLDKLKWILEKFIQPDLKNKSQFVLSFGKRASADLPAKIHNFPPETKIHAKGWHLASASVTTIFHPKKRNIHTETSGCSAWNPLQNQSCSHGPVAWSLQRPCAIRLFGRDRPGPQSPWNQRITTILDGIYQERWVLAM